KDMVEAIEFGYKGVKDTLKLIDQLVSKAGREKVFGELVLPSDEIVAKVRQVAEKDMIAARQIAGKHDRADAVDALRKKVLDEHFPINENGSWGDWNRSVQARAQAKEAFRTLEKKVTRKLMVEKKIRADGRGATDIRPIIGKVGIFERT